MIKKQSLNIMADYKNISVMVSQRKQELDDNISRRNAKMTNAFDISQSLYDMNEQLVDSAESILLGSILYSLDKLVNNAVKYSNELTKRTLNNQQAVEDLKAHLWNCVMNFNDSNEPLKVVFHREQQKAAKFWYKEFFGGF